MSSMASDVQQQLNNIRANMGTPGFVATEVPKVSCWVKNGKWVILAAAIILIIVLVVRYKSKRKVQAVALPAPAAPPAAAPAAAVAAAPVAAAPAAVPATSSVVRDSNFTPFA